MLRNKALVAAATLLCAVSADAQVMTPSDVQDPQCRRLQQEYLPQLIAAGEQVRELQFPYPFYLSRVLDVSERKQQTLAPGSIHFDKFENQPVLQITGNYFASYSTRLLDNNR